MRYFEYIKEMPVPSPCLPCISFGDHSKNYYSTSAQYSRTVEPPIFLRASPRFLSPLWQVSAAEVSEFQHNSSEPYAPSRIQRLGSLSMTLTRSFPPMVSFSNSRK